MDRTPDRLVLAVVEASWDSSSVHSLAVITPLLRMLARWAVAVGGSLVKQAALLFTYVIEPLARVVGTVRSPSSLVGSLRGTQTGRNRLSPGSPQLIARWARRVGRSLVHRNRRVAHSVGVAFLRARAAQPIRRQRTLRRSPPAHRSTAAPHDLPFEVVAYQNEYLPSGATEVHAIIEVVAVRSAFRRP